LALVARNFRAFSLGIDAHRRFHNLLIAVAIGRSSRLFVLKSPDNKRNVVAFSTDVIATLNFVFHHIGERPQR